MPLRKSRERLTSIVAAVATAAALALAYVLIQKKAEPLRMVQSSLLPPEKSRFVFDNAPMALSPDGRRLAFLAPSLEGKNLLWIRALDGLSAQPLAGTEGATYPFWSPDSRFLGFFAGGKLKKIEASGGPSQTVCDAAEGRGGTWSRGGVILFTPTSRDPIHRVSSSGGASTAVTKVEPSRSEYSHRWPLFLPDGRHFLYLALSPGVGERRENNAIYAASLDSKETKLLLRANSNVSYSPPGYLLYFREKSLLAHPFDAKRLRLTEEAFPSGRGGPVLPRFRQRNLLRLGQRGSGLSGRRGRVPFSVDLV